MLFLDELPERKRQALGALRRPLENRQIGIARANAKLTYPYNKIWEYIRLLLCLDWLYLI
jgi:predicted ATPase with chaperone activity